jgi:hypothetical protein
MEVNPLSKQVLYKIIKIKTSKIRSKISRLKEKDKNGKRKFKEPHEYNVGEYSFKDALLQNEIVTIGDNLVFHKIRDYYEIKESPEEIYDKIANLYTEIASIKRKPTSDENIKLLSEKQQEIQQIVYIKDIVNVKVVNKEHYKDIALNGFTMNGIKYKRLCVGSGQMRRNTVTFVNEKLYDYLLESLMCGLSYEKIGKMNLAKFSAYFALSFSSVLWVKTPRICVVDDYETIIPKQNIDYIVTDENGSKHVETRVMDIALNSADGQGLMSPEYAKAISEQLGLPKDKVLCEAIVRTSFVKGLLVTVDFKSYAKNVCGKNKIKSIYGEEFDIDDIDVILSRSMFKLHAHYKSVKEYVEYHEKNNLKWGITRYNKIIDDDYSLLNYQYIQNNNLDNDALQEIISPTVDWLRKICSGQEEYSLLYTLGCKKEDAIYDDSKADCGALFTQVILKNADMLQDGYIKRKIYNSIKESFRQAKIGRIWCKGNYQFMISDPIPFLRNALDCDDVRGLIPANHVYSEYWNKYKPKSIDLMRSPMVDRHEHNVVNLADNSEMRLWYKYLYSGIIYSIYDTSVIRHSDSDFDGDIVFSTDNIQLINGAYSNNNPITYDKKKAPEMTMTYANIVECDLNGFDTLVGQITNNSTSITAMLPNFPQDRYPEEHQELINRLKILREIIGSEIDKIKLGVSPEFPKEWIKQVKIDETDSDIEKAIKYKHNSLVINKKAYFMIYIYDNLKRSYFNHLKQFDLDCKNKYGMSLKELRYKKNKTKDQYAFINSCNYFSCVLDTPCTMNKLCHIFEKLEKDILYDKSLNDSILNNFNQHKYEINKDTYNTLHEYYKQYKSQKQFAYTKPLLNELFNEDDAQEYIMDMSEILGIEFSEKCFNLISNKEQLFEYLLSLGESYQAKNQPFDYSFIWTVLGDDILELIPFNSKVCVETKDGEEGVMYMGSKYKIIEVVNSDNME